MDDATRDLFFLSCIGMTEREREVMVDRFLLERGPSEIARDMGITAGRVRQLEAKARGRVTALLLKGVAA